MSADLNSLRVAISLATAHPNPQGPDEAIGQDFRALSAQALREAFFNIADALKATILFECGAHEASTSTTFLKSGAQRRAVAVEANPWTYEAKTKLAEQHGVIVLHRGLGAEQGEAMFHVPQGHPTWGNASFRKDKDASYDSVPVPVETLDSLTPQYVRPDDVAAFWVDVEGLALEVLQGGPNTLAASTCRLIMIEVETQQLWSGQAVLADVDKVLVSHGFVPVLRDVEYVGQFNLIYVRGSDVNLLDEIIMAYWRSLSMACRASPGRSSAPPGRLAASKLKHAILGLRNPQLNGLVHRAASALGSHSSRAAVRDDAD